MPQPADITRIETELTTIYNRVQQILETEQTRLLQQGITRTNLTRLRTTIAAILDTTDQQTRTWLADRFPTIYLLGANTAADTVDPFALIHQRALQRLTADLFNDLLTATRYVRRDTKRFIREAAQLVADAKLREGRTAVQASRVLERIIAEHGIKGLTYRDGSRHTIGEYAEVAIRSTTARAYNEGTVNAAADSGIVWFECFDGPACGWLFHDDTETANGKIVTADEALSNPISHPNCRRSFGARPDLTTRTGTRSTTAAQNRDQGRFDARRQLAQRTARRPRTPRQPRTARTG